MLKEMGLNFQDDLQIFMPKIGYFVNEIDKGISFIKINHSFWEMLAGMELWVEHFAKRHDKQFIEEVKHIVKIVDSLGIKLAVSGKPGPRDVVVNGTNLSIKNHLPKNYIPFDATCWQKFALNGQLRILFKSIKEKKVVLVGLSHLAELPKILGLRDCQHFRIGMFACFKERREIILNELKQIVEKHSKNGDKAIFIFQCGECFSAWLIYHLHMMKVGGFSYIDMGRSLDWFCPNRQLTKIDEEQYPFQIETFRDQQFWMLKRKIFI